MFALTTTGEDQRHPQMFAFDFSKSATKNIKLQRRHNCDENWQAWFESIKEKSPTEFFYCVYESLQVKKLAQVFVTQRFHLLIREGSKK